MFFILLGKGQMHMYQALYRKYRPKVFKDVIGQPHVTVTLQNELLSGRIGHAYLFIGSRGTGKTTCAKIFAKAVNCTGLTDGNPCGECDLCREIDSGEIMDIVELDAASNNGVNDIREICESAAFTHRIDQRCSCNVGEMADTGDNSVVRFRIDDVRGSA